MLLSSHIFTRVAAALLIAGIALPALAQKDSGWKSSSPGTDRYSAASGDQKKSPFATAPSNPSAAAAPANSQPSNEITPVGGGLAPVNQAVSHAHVTKGSGALPKDKARCGASTTSRPYTSARQQHRPSRADASSTGSSARPATRPGTRSRSVC